MRQKLEKPVSRKNSAKQCCLQSTGRRSVFLQMYYRQKSEKYKTRRKNWVAFVDSDLYSQHLRNY